MSLRTLADTAYVIRVDKLTARAIVEYQVAAAVAMAGGKGADGQPITVTTPEEQIDEFDAALERPLDYERMRAAILKEALA